MFTLEQLKKAIELSRQVKDGKLVCDIDQLLGLTEVCTHNMELMYPNDEQIIEIIKSQ